jgi:hypothetical protein
VERYIDGSEEVSCCTGDDKVESPEFLDCGVDGCLHGLYIPDIRCNGETPRTLSLALNFLRHRLESVLSDHHKQNSNCEGGEEEFRGAGRGYRWLSSSANNRIRSERDQCFDLDAADCSASAGAKDNCHQLHTMSPLPLSLKMFGWKTLVEYGIVAVRVTMLGRTKGR